MNQKNDQLVPQIVPRSIAGGILLMAFFTYGWIRIAMTGLQASYMIWFWLAILFATFLIVNAVYFFIVSKHFPRLSSEADKAEGKRMGMWYGIVFGGEGVVIGGVCAALGITGHTEFIIPSIALIVGVHFFPMAKLFKRTIDYYIATWTCIVGIIAIYMVFKKIDPKVVNTFTGFGVACATATYGLYMIVAGHKLVRATRY